MLVDVPLNNKDSHDLSASTTCRLTSYKRRTPIKICNLRRGAIIRAFNGIWPTLLLTLSDLGMHECEFQQKSGQIYVPSHVEKCRIISKGIDQVMPEFNDGEDHVQRVQKPFEKLLHHPVRRGEEHMPKENDLAQNVKLSARHVQPESHKHLCSPHISGTSNPGDNSWDTKTSECWCTRRVCGMTR